MNLAIDPAPLCQPTTAQEVQTALRSPATRRVLHETVAGLLPPGPPPLTFRLQRVKCKPGRKLTVTYDLAVGLTPGRPVTVTWFAPDHFEPASEAVDQGLEDEACRRGVAQRVAEVLEVDLEELQADPTAGAFPLHKAYLKVLLGRERRRRQF